MEHMTNIIIPRNESIMIGDTKRQAANRTSDKEKLATRDARIKQLTLEVRMLKRHIEKYEKHQVTLMEHLDDALSMLYKELPKESVLTSKQILADIYDKAKQ